jgi:hypothetical protein
MGAHRANFGPLHICHSSASAHGESRVGAMFYARGKNNAQVSVQHLRLTDRNAAAKMKSYFPKELDRLRTQIES